VQYEALRHIRGFDNVRIFRPGYAIEYDYFPPTQLKHSLETKQLDNLFFAGQINGTTGYEEAACQGLMAGINAHQKTKELAPVILKRSEAYIGVLIDDLISKGTEEPYRMFTSRAEFRTLLRQDNADLRLTELSYRLGLASQERMEKTLKKKEEVESIKGILKDFSIEPQESETFLQDLSSAPLLQKQKALQVLLRPNIDLYEMSIRIPRLGEQLKQYSRDSLEQAEIQVKYNTYIEKEKDLVQRMTQLEDLSIPENFDYERITSL
jgi:tRNA uridine 5-carboxymethylaminomethyl modification enzyme